MVTDPQALAARLADAAGLIKVHGHYVDHDFWPDAHEQDWTPGLPLDITAAVYVAQGVTSYRAVVAAMSRAVDPAIAALAWHLGFRSPGDAALAGLWEWEDRTPGVFVASALQRCAADLRAVVTCLSCGAEWPNHYAHCEFVRSVRDELAVAA
jgi:hypothetical protein